MEFTNESIQHTRGLEAELSGQLQQGLQGTVSYSFQNSRALEDPFEPNSPQQLAKANLSIPLAHRRFAASFGGQYTSRMRTVTGPILGSYTLVNATLVARRLAKNLEASANVDNLFNKRYADSGGLEHREVSIPQDGRSFRVKLIYRFSSR